MVTMGERQEQGQEEGSSSMFEISIKSINQ